MFRRNDHTWSKAAENSGGKCKKSAGTCILVRSISSGI